MVMPSHDVSSHSAFHEWAAALGSGASTAALAGVTPPTWLGLPSSIALRREATAGGHALTTWQTMQRIDAVAAEGAAEAERTSAAATLPAKAAGGGGSDESLPQWLRQAVPMLETLEKSLPEVSGSLSATFLPTLMGVFDIPNGDFVGCVCFVCLCVVLLVSDCNG